jgi:hypothetical protein
LTALAACAFQHRVLREYFGFNAQPETRSGKH